ncbi:restriction endonuclease subunit S [Streptococcus salivarius]|uniref:Restriction endonuclease subunit S n=1 Tax=Streptococcus salivarius TaxID=1304 RepID=A0AAX2V333_STRSL|nr:restriction endonuclease subunit S [Streptococcus salivarius]TNF68187.1 restriction endonuclease subunit S [Streptococcus salivarius]
MEKPKIRFLKNKHSWVRNTFEEIAKRRTKSSDNPDLPRVEYQDIISGEGRLNKDLNKNIDCRKGIMFETNDILYGKLRPYLKNWLHPNFNGIALGDFWVLQARNCDSKFLFSLVQSPKFQRVANDTSGTKMPRSDWKTVSQTEFSIPTSNDEQSAIGSLFHTLDDLLTSNKDNLANYQSLKTTMLTKIFPKAGQTIPEIRLEGFKGDWEKYYLGDIFEQVSNYIEPSVENELWSLTVEKGLTPKTDRYKRDFLVKKNDKFKKVDINEFVYNPMNLTLGALDLNNKGRTISVSGYYVVMKNTDVEKFDNDFFKILLKTTYAIYQYKQFATGTLIEKQRVQFPTFSEIPFYLPTIAEQRAIGAYFSILDNLIATHQEKISQLETLKKKLLQDMFI